LDLFSHTKQVNLLPKDGEVFYYRNFLSVELSNKFFHTLEKNISWKRDENIILGKKILTKRLVAWYGDRPFIYTYSGTRKVASLWTPELLELKELVEKVAKESFNSCLLNFYHTGEEGMSWHSDAEDELKKHGTIASVSLGAERKFVFRHKKDSKLKVSVFLENGSLLLMKKETQTYWQHCLPIAKKIKSPRINLTFRIIV